MLGSHSHDADESVISELHEVSSVACLSSELNSFAFPGKRFSKHRLIILRQWLRLVQDENRLEKGSKEPSERKIYSMLLAASWTWCLFPGQLNGNRFTLQKINFELVKTKAGTQHDKQTRKRPPPNRHNKSHCTFEHEKPPSVTSILSPNMLTHRAPEIVESLQSSRDYQPRRFRSKVRNMFACLHRSQSRTEHNEDVEAGLSNAHTTEVYHFDHGSSAYFQTTDCPPHLVSEIIAQRTTYHATKFWAEFFGSINIGVTFFVTFILQFYRWVFARHCNFTATRPWSFRKAFMNFPGELTR